MEATDPSTSLRVAIINIRFSHLKTIIMARLKKGIIDQLSGTIGPVVGATWRGIPYIRTKPTTSNRKRKKKSSDAQAATRIRFGMAAKLLRYMREILELGFRDEAFEKTGMNAAISYTMKHAITGEFPDFKIAFDHVLISRGKLPNVEQPTVTAQAPEAIRFKWTNNEGVGKAAGEDKVLLVAYDEENEAVVYKIGATRLAGSDILDMPAFSGYTVHTWISFISADNRDIANSVYTGTVVVK
jgi:hypothetical protein